MSTDRIYDKIHIIRDHLEEVLLEMNELDCAKNLREFQRIQDALIDVLGEGMTDEDWAECAARIVRQRNAYRTSAAVLRRKHRAALAAIKEISPWLSASLEGETCMEYQKACDAIMIIDQENSRENL